MRNARANFSSSGVIKYPVALVVLNILSSNKAILTGIVIRRFVNSQ